MKRTVVDWNSLFSQVQSRVKRQENLCDSLRAILADQPEAAERILTTARNACEGKVILSGTMGKPFFVGKPPHWHEDMVNDGEFVVELNRMQHWNDCIIAYALTGERVFPELIVSEMADWIKSCPRPAVEGDWDEVRPNFRGPKPWSSLEGGLRMMNAWYNAFCFLMQEDFMTPALFPLFVGSVEDHAEMLMKVPPKLWPEANHNHYLSENVGLFYAGEMLQELPEAKEWQAQAERELERCAKNQLTLDGGQVEGCPLYHNVCIDMFGKWALSAKRCGVEIPSDVLQQIRNAIDYALYSLRPTGEGVPWGDSDPDDQIVQTVGLGYRVFGSREWVDAVCRIIPLEKLKKMSTRYCFSLIGVSFDSFAKAADFRTDELQLPLSNWQHQLQQVMFRTGWDKDALSVFFACRVPCQNGHGHIDPAGFDFCGLGKALLVDPGRYTYREEEMRQTIKSAKMHNTLTIGGREPFTYISSFHFANEKDGCILDLSEGENYTAAQALHTSYFPMIHQRLVAILDRSILLVWDRVDHMTGEEPVEIWYNANTLTAALQSDGTVATHDDVNFCLRASEGLHIDFQPGVISEQVDAVRPSTRIRMTDNASEKGVCNYLSVIVPYQENCPKISAVRFEEDGKTASFSIGQKKYQCSWRDDRFHFDLSCC